MKGPSPGVAGEFLSREVTITEEDIVEFARRYDPQPMHMDPAAAAKGPHGTVIASGWHIAALTLKVFVEAGGYGDTPVLGLGNDELRWNKVVRPGDRLTVKREPRGAFTDSPSLRRNRMRACSVGIK